STSRPATPTRSWRCATGRSPRAARPRRSCARTCWRRSTACPCGSTSSTDSSSRPTTAERADHTGRPTVSKATSRSGSLPPAVRVDAGMTDALKLSAEAQDLLFREARTANTFTDEPVTDEQVAAIHDLVKYGPTAMNSQPLRVILIRSDEARARLLKHM